MQFKKLSELCELIIDCPHETPDWKDSGYLVLRNFNVGDGRINKGAPSYTDEENYIRRIRRVKPKAGDIVISREAPMGNVGIIPDGVTCCLGQRMVLLRPNPEIVDNYYLAYRLMTSEVQKQIKYGGGSGTTVGNLQIPNLKDLNIPIDEIEEQRKIATILRNIDDKIEINNKINNILANQSLILFQYQFPNIFQGTNTIGTYCVPKRGDSLIAKDAIPGDVPVVAGGREPSTYHNRTNTEAPVITISSSGANAGYINLWHQPVWSSDSSFIDKSITDNIYFWYAVLKLRQEEIFGRQTGSAQPHIYPEHISSLTIGEINLSSINDYENSVTPLYKLISNNQIENRNLYKLRNWLLPILMNRQAIISD